MAFLALLAIDGSFAFSGSGNDDAHSCCNGLSASQRSSLEEHDEDRVAVPRLQLQFLANVQQS